MNNFIKLPKQEGARVELHDQLALTGAEISINTIPLGGCVPFVHAHQQNEEIYYILSGSGKAVVDGQEVCLQSGDWLKIDPVGKRQFFASEDQELSYLCIQVKAHSLDQYTADDAIIG